MAKSEPSKKNESVAKTQTKNEAKKMTGTEQVRARSGTWGSATGTKQKEPALKTIKTQVKKEKEVRRSSDERRQKRGEI